MVGGGKQKGKRQLGITGGVENVAIKRKFNQIVSPGSLLS